jgi:nucleoside-triphosphatase
MPQNFFITGLPKAGKTVLLRRLIRALRAQGLTVGGLISPEEKHHGTRTGFYVMDIASGRIGRLADTGSDGPKVSKYHVDVKSFESVAIPAMESYESCDVFVIDEVGPMELKSARFSDLLDGILDSDTPLIASVHTDLAPGYAVNGELILLAENNREAVYDELLESIRTIHKRPAGKKAPAVAAAKKMGKAAAKPAPRAKKAVAAKEGKAKPAKKKGKARAVEAPKKAGKEAKAEKRQKETAPKPEPARREEAPEKAAKKEKKGFFHHLKELFHG